MYRNPALYGSLLGLLVASCSEDVSGVDSFGSRGGGGTGKQGTATDKSTGAAESGSEATGTSDDPTATGDETVGSSTTSGEGSGEASTSAGTNTGVDSGGEFGPCCEASGAPGCGDDGIEACVCSTYMQCCLIGWDAACVGWVNATGCGDCGPI